MTDNTQVPEKGQTSETTVPSKSQDGETKKENEINDLPESYKGKSAAEIARMHQELEQKLGQQSQFVGQTRQQLAQWEALGKVIQSNPALYSQIDYEIKKLAGQVPNQNQTKADPKIREIENTVSDTRRAQQGEIFDKFEEKMGISSLPDSDKKELQGKIGKELSEMLDYTGKKTFDQILSEVPLDRLRPVLEKAYKLAVGDEKGKLRAVLEANKNKAGMFGNIPSGSSRSDDESLSPEERKVAQRLGVKEEAYLKQKQAIGR